MDTAQDRTEAGGPAKPRVCIVGASGKLGRYMVQHALDRGYEVVGVCRERSVAKLDAFEGRITVIPGATDDREVIARAVAGCDGVLTVLVPRGVHHYSSGTAQAVLDHARPGARLVFSCGWHITRDGQDVYSWKVKALVQVVGRLAKLARLVDLDDQVEACRRIFASDTRWTVVRGSDLEEGDSQGLPVWSRHVGDPILAEQHHPPRGLRPVHGGGARERRAGPRGTGDRRLPDALRARAAARSDMSTVTEPTVRQSGPTTASTRRTAALVGLLFLTATAAFICADTLNSGVLSRPDFLAGASADTTALAAGALLLSGQFGVVGIAVLLFPLLKRHGESLALAHVGFRVGELAASLFYLAVPLLVIELGARLSDGTLDASASAGLGALLQAQYGVAILMIYLVTTAAGMCMSTLLYRSRLIPRWIAALGVVGYPVLLAGCVLDMFGVVDVTQGLGLVALVPGGVFELILPIWLLAKGFTFPRDG